MLCNTCILRCHHSSFSFSFFSSYLFFLRSLPSFLMTVQRIEACQRALLYTHLVFLNCCCYYCLSLSLLLVECCAKHADHARSFISGITWFILVSNQHKMHKKKPGSQNTFVNCRLTHLLLRGTYRMIFCFSPPFLDSISILAPYKNYWTARPISGIV